MKREGQSRARHLPEWERLLSTQLIFQSRYPECVLVGGTAASLHARHRVSIDADYVLPDLKKRFAEILRRVEREAGWVTKRIEPPVMILGHFRGVRTGIRQLLRDAPLETTTVKGLRIPTPGEMLRIKGYLIVRRNTTRDFIDFVALFDHIGARSAVEELGSLDRLYPQKGDVTLTAQLAIQLSEPKPWDLASTDLGAYKALAAPYADWSEIRRRAFSAGQRIMAERLGTAGSGARWKGR